MWKLRRLSEAIKDRARGEKVELRKLEHHEYEKSRELWEKIFVDDTKEFLDYYYARKTENNEIYGIFEDEKLVSMIHLNPYDVCVNDKTFPLHYIVAVATDADYRKRGLMGQLLKKTMRIMHDRKEPFTFLMPAAEAIYHPYDFRFVYTRKQGKIYGENTEAEVEILPAAEKDCGKLAVFAKERLKEYQVFSNRTSDYYRTMIAEQNSCNGDVMMIQKQGELVGMFCYAKGDSYEIREPLFLEEQDFLKAVYLLTKSEMEAVKCTEYGMDKKPIVMARILHLETFLKSLKLDKDVDLRISLEDKFIEENNGVFHVVGNKKEGITLVEKIEDSHSESKPIPIGDFTKAVFEKYLPKVFFDEIV